MNPQVNVIPFSGGNPFFAALSSALLPSLGYTQETPYYCGQKGSNCINCGSCKGITTLQKHQGQLYHDYLALTGVSFGWAWPELDADYHTIEGAGAGWRWPDAFIDFIMGHAGLAWRRMSKDAGEGAIYQAITASVDAGFPVLLKLGAGPEWQVAAGHQNGALYALGFGEKGRTLRNWYNSFEDAIIITGRCEPTVTLADVLRRVIAVLEHPAHARLEAGLNRRIDEIAPENAQETAKWLGELSDFPIYARFHAAAAFDTGEAAVNGIQRMTDHKAVSDLLRRVFDRYLRDGTDETHGVLWRVWDLLGMSPRKDHDLPKNAGELILRPEAQAELKRLFALVFKNDRDVLAAMREALTLLSSGGMRNERASEKN